MMRKFVVLCALVGLTACGVDGPPMPPEDDRDRPEPGISISGTAEFGVAGGSTTVRR